MIDPAARLAIDALLPEIQGVLGRALVGVYLFGSAAEGDFDPILSDVDLCAVLERDADDAQLEALRAMHAAFVRERPVWEDRIEVIYISAEALARFFERESPLVVISPGEPLHRIRTSPGWLMNWHRIREAGETLTGPPPASIFPPSTNADFVDAVRGHLDELARRAVGDRTPRERAYLVLTACRGLRTCTEGDHLSKDRAADWAAETHPEWATLIRAAARARRREGDPADLSDAASFVDFARDRARR